MTPRLAKIRQPGTWHRLVWLLWLAMLVSVPVTSLPAITTVLGPNPVSPLAMIPMGLLLLLWLLPYLLSGGRLPGLAGPLLFFGLVAGLACGVGLLLPIEPYKGQTVLFRELRSLVTLGIGLGFYLLAVTLPDSAARLRRSLQAIYLGLVVMLVWATVQLQLVFDPTKRVPLVLNNIHHWFSFRDLLEDRVVGLAYEPSWLADQLVLLYLPLLLGAVLTRQSLFPRRWGGLWVEACLAAWCAAILVFTQSRIGYLSAVLIFGAILLHLALRLAGWLERRLPTSALSRSRGGRRLLRGGILLAGLLAVGLAAGIAGEALSRVDRRMTRLTEIPTRIEQAQMQFQDEAGFRMADYLGIAERAVLWHAGMRVFVENPLLGVGLGNAGFLLGERLPAYAHRLDEIRSTFSLSRFEFPNTKSLWVRLLAETGVLGFSAVLAWLTGLALAGWMLIRRGAGEGRWLGVAGLLALVALLTEGFSLDTLSLPHLWVLLGLLTAAAWAHLGARESRPTGAVAHD